MASGLSSIYIILIEDLINSIYIETGVGEGKYACQIKWELKKLANFSSTKVGIQ